MSLATAHRWVLRGVFACAPYLSISSWARAAESDHELAPAPITIGSSTAEAPEDDDDEPVAAPSGFTMDGKPGWSVGVDAYGGIAAQAADRSVSHGLLGVLGRLRWTYFEAGGTYEVSDRTFDRWRTIGVFAGAFIPYSRWVDFEFTVGGASRRYDNDDPRYGGKGYTFTVPALTFRAGVSDKTTERLLGARVGVHLAGVIDMQHPDAPWRYVLEPATEGVPEQVVTGVTSIGGFTMALLFSVGVDVGQHSR